MIFDTVQEEWFVEAANQCDFSNFIFSEEALKQIYWFYYWQSEERGEEIYIRDIFIEMDKSWGEFKSEEDFIYQMGSNEFKSIDEARNRGLKVWRLPNWGHILVHCP